MVPILLNLDFLLESRHMESDRDCSCQPTGSYFGPKVRFRAVAALSDVFQPQVVVHRVPQFLLESELDVMCCST